MKELRPTVLNKMVQDKKILSRQKCIIAIQQNGQLR